MSRYSDDWNAIALAIKERAGWRCSKCGMQCIRPGEDVAGLTKSERAARTLTVHHWNRDPQDNRVGNLAALCSGCHLSYHMGMMAVFQDEKSDLFIELIDLSLKVVRIAVIIPRLIYFGCYIVEKSW